MAKLAMADPSLYIKIPDPLGPLVSIKTADENKKTNKLLISKKYLSFDRFPETLSVCPL